MISNPKKSGYPQKSNHITVLLGQCQTNFTKICSHPR